MDNNQKALVYVSVLSTGLGIAIGALIRQIRVVDLEGQLEVTNLQYKMLETVAEHQIEINKTLNEKLKKVQQ